MCKQNKKNKNQEVWQYGKHDQLEKINIFMIMQLVNEIVDDPMDWMWQTSLLR
jgi:hypothetical protein